ncbi:Imm1 family immunity protein [Asanoa siamensis]|nr:Imm1 family immunity protein [Asanoa siamensis]
MEYDVNEAGQRQLIVVQSPTLDDVVSALDALDRASRTTLTLIDGSGAYLSVGGGDGLYHVYLGAFDHDDRVILQSAGTGELEHDGHRYSAPDVVDRDTARAALSEFHRTGRPDLGLAWRAG